MNSSQIFEKIRAWLYGILGILFILDFITTIIGINQGLIELNERLAPIVKNMVLHFLIKMIFPAVLIGYFEYKFRRDKKSGNADDKCYSFFILILVCVILVFCWVVKNNVELIISTF